MDFDENVSGIFKMKGTVSLMRWSKLEWKDVCGSEGKIVLFLEFSAIK